MAHRDETGPSDCRDAGRPWPLSSCWHSDARRAFFQATTRGPSADPLALTSLLAVGVAGNRRAETLFASRLRRRSPRVDRSQRHRRVVSTAPAAHRAVNLSFLNNDRLLAMHQKHRAISQFSMRQVCTRTARFL